jgi:hypothetical protein
MGQMVSWDNYVAFERRLQRVGTREKAIVGPVEILFSKRTLKLLEKRFQVC